MAIELYSEFASSRGHRTTFDGRAEVGRPLAIWLFFARVAAGERGVMRKIVLVR